MFRKNKFTKTPLVKIKITGNIFYEYGFFKMTQIYFNEQKHSISTKYVFPIPADSIIKDITIFKKNKKIIGAKILEKNEIKDVKVSLKYRKIKAIIKYISKDICSLTIDEISSKNGIKVSVEYYKELFLKENKSKIEIPLTLFNKDLYENNNVTENDSLSKTNYLLDLNLEVNNVLEIFNVYSPSHDILFERFKTYSLITFEKKDVSNFKDIEIMITYKENKINKAINVKNSDFGIAYCSVYPNIQ
ncbi:MAG: hypothetical protein LBJ09_02225 [Clostridiales bacterium]|jgi:hypothetical protein|nr:hypothetical protein [Clostridiales bacterium]